LIIKDLLKFPLNLNSKELSPFLSLTPSQNSSGGIYDCIVTVFYMILLSKRRFCREFLFNNWL